MPYRHPAVALIAAVLAIDLLTSGGSGPDGVSPAHPRAEAGLREPAGLALLASVSTASVAEALQELAHAGVLEDPELAGLRPHEPEICRRPEEHSAAAVRHQA